MINWIKKHFHDWNPWNMKFSAVFPGYCFGHRTCKKCGVRQETGSNFSGGYTSKVPFFCKGKKIET